LCAATEKLTGCVIERAYVDKGYRGHDTANPHRVFHLRSETWRLRHHQARTAPPLGHRSVIGHIKTDGHLGRCHLKGPEGDAANVILTAVGYNLRLVFTWLSRLLRLILLALCPAISVAPAANGLLNGRLVRMNQADASARFSGRGGFDVHFLLFLL
jgi:IS5 family transposase